MIKIRIDVDYPYPSRLKSFINVASGATLSGSYLKNSKIVAKIINESPKDVKAYWFFTYKTIPDNELLTLLGGDKHEVSLHVVNDPQRELKQLEKATGRKIRYYTIHGTARLFARIIWKRWKSRVPHIPKDFPLQSFHQFPTSSLDVKCRLLSPEQVVKIAEDQIKDGLVLEIHPIWLFQRGTINRRGPFYETFRRLLEVDKELETVAARKKLFFKIAIDTKEYARDTIPTDVFIEKLGERGIDIFSFTERKWRNTISNAPQSWSKAEDNIALLKVATYAEWWKKIGKKTRNMVRKAEKSGVETAVVESSEKLAEGIWNIYNDTPIRQERAFPHYGTPLHAVTRGVLSAQNCVFIGAFFQDELAGFIQLVYDGELAIISQILSLQKHADKAVNNALVAKAVEVCAARSVGWVMYGRIGNHPSLDRFKESNGFVKFPLTRYYLPITRKGRIAVKLGLHRELRDTLPQAIKSMLFPLYNWVSRTKMRMRLRFGAG